MDLKALEREYGRFPGVYLERSHDIEHVASSDMLGGSWQYLELQHHRYVVLDPDSEKLTTFKCYLERDWELVKVNLQIIHPDGTRNVFSKSDLTRETASEGRQAYKFAYPRVVKGSQIEEQMEIRVKFGVGRPPIYQDIPLQYDIPCLKAQFSFAYPDWWRISVKKIGPDRTVQTQTQYLAREHKKVIRCTRTDVPAIEDEPFSPFFKEMAEYLEFEITHLEIGSSIYDAPKTWNDFASRFKRYVMDKDAKFSMRVQRTARDLTENLDSSLEKLEAIVSYVQEEISTDADETGNFAKVLKEKRGDAPTNTALTQRMLSAIQIPSKFILLHSASDGYFDETFVSQHQLYLLALMVQIQDKTYVVFPYMKGLPVEHLPRPFQGQKALAITMGGSAEFLETPRGNQFENAVDETFDLTISEDGKIKVKERKMLYGAEAFWARSLLKEMKDEEKDELLERLMTYSDGDVTHLNHRFDAVEEYKKPLVIHLEYDIDNLVTVMPDEILFQTGGLFTPSSKLKNKVRHERENPIAIHYDINHHKKIVIHYPGSWKLVQGPENISRENDFGSISAQAAESTGKLELDIKSQLKACQKPADQFEGLLEIAGTQAFRDWDTFVFEPR